MSEFIYRQPEPLSTINITPLIDVMLVLLIMMIMTLPPPTHKVGIDLPGKAASAGEDRPIHRLSILANGAYLWDGKPLTDDALPARLQSFNEDAAGPVLHMETDPAAAYDRFDHTLAIVKRAGIERVGFAGNPPAF